MNINNRPENNKLRCNIADSKVNNYCQIFFFFIVYPSKLDQVENRRADSPENISICPGLIYMGK